MTTTAVQLAKELIRQGKWKEVTDRNGHLRTYYFNVETRERAWDLVSYIEKHKLHLDVVLPLEGHAADDLTPQSSGISVSQTLVASDMLKSKVEAFVVPQVQPSKSPPPSPVTSTVPDKPVRTQPPLATASTKIPPPALTTTETILPLSLKSAVTALKRMQLTPAQQQQRVELLSWLSLHTSSSSSFFGLSTTSMSQSWVVAATTSVSDSVELYQLAIAVDGDQPPSLTLSLLSASGDAVSQVAPSSRIKCDHLCLLPYREESVSEDVVVSTPLSGVYWCALHHQGAVGANRKVGAILTLLSPSPLGVPWSLCGFDKERASSNSSTNVFRSGFAVGTLPDSLQSKVSTIAMRISLWIQTLHGRAVLPRPRDSAVRREDVVEACNDSGSTTVGKHTMAAMLHDATSVRTSSASTIMGECSTQVSARGGKAPQRDSRSSKLFGAILSELSALESVVSKGRPTSAVI